MISPETIALVKDRTDLVALVAETVKLTKRGRRFLGLCPFHQEKSPSFNVNPENGFFHCFGCKESGGALDFIMKTEGYSFPEAVRVLAERAGIQVSETATDAEQREANAARRAKDDLFHVSSVAATFFERSLRGRAAHPLAHHARRELERRGLPIPEDDSAVGEAARISDTLQAFRIGYAPFGWDGLAAYLKQQGISPVLAEKVGLLVPRSSGSGYYDRFRHRLMFAVTDVLGRVIAFSGRALPDPSPEEVARHRLTGPSASPDGPPAKYINSPESPIYTKGEHLFGLHQARQAIRQEGEATLVEGNFDVVSLHARGIGTAVAPLGTAFTVAQAKLLKRFAPRVLLFFDGDKAGRKAIWASRTPCREGGLQARVASLPKGLDPDDFVRQNGPEGVKAVEKAARGLKEYLIDDALDDEAFRGATLDEQKARIAAVTKLIGEERDPTDRMMVKTYADRLSSRLVVMGHPPNSLRELEASLERAVGYPTGHEGEHLRANEAPVEPYRARSKDQAAAIPLQLLGALLDFPELLDDPEVGQALDVLDGEMVTAIFALRRRLEVVSAEANGEPNYSEEGSSRPPNRIYSDEFLAQIPRSIHSFAVGRLASPEFESVDEARRELLDNARKLKRLSLTRENAAIVDLTKQAEAQGDMDSVTALLRESERKAQAKRRK